MKGKRYDIRGFLNGRCTIKINRNYQPIIRKGKKWLVRFKGGSKMVHRQGRRHFIISRGKIRYFRWTFRILFMGVSREVKYRRGRWLLGLKHHKFREIRKRLGRYIGRNGHRYPITRRRGNTYIRIRNLSRKVTMKRERRGRRGQQRKRPINAMSILLIKTNVYFAPNATNLSSGKNKITIQVANFELSL